MNNKQIPTAEEFLNQRDCINSTEDFFNNVQPIDLIEFAKLHVEASLKEALESIPCLGSSTDIATYEEVRDAVLNAYPLKNIK